MKNTLKTVLAVVVGFVVASALMMAVETANGKMFYPEMGRAAEGVTDREVLRQLLASAPVGAMLVVLAGWFAGAVAGGWVAAAIAGRARAAHALAVGGLVALGAVANNLMLPPPVWFWVAGPLVPLVAGWLTARFVRARQ